MPVTLTLYRFKTPGAKLWAFTQMGLAGRSLRAIDGVEDFKLLGSGAGAGFSTRPNFGVYGQLIVWRDQKSMEAAFGSAPVLRAYERHACEHLRLLLATTRTRGSWSGREPFAVDADPHQPGEPIVALTRATLKLSKARHFWSLVPAISDVVEVEEHKRFMIGLGEVPWLHQVTLSIWTDEAAMRDFAMRSETHGVAVRRAWAEGWFKDYLFARFRLLDVAGSWTGFDVDRFQPIATVSKGRKPIDTSPQLDAAE